MAPDASSLTWHEPPPNGIAHAETFPAVPNTNSNTLSHHTSIRNSNHGPTTDSHRVGRPHSVSLSAHFKSITEKRSRERSVGEKSSHSQNWETAAAENRSAQRAVRTVPAWVDSVDEDDLPYLDPTIRQRPTAPANAHVAQHNFLPVSRENDQTASAYGDTPITTRGPLESRWRTFVTTTGYARHPMPNEKRVDPDWINENWTDYSVPWLSNRNESDLEDGAYEAFKRKREHWLKRFQRLILRSPMVPLVIRLSVFFTSTIALALGGRIHHLTDQVASSQGPSAEMAISVDAVALVYTCYITWDEYTGKPLGLRSAKAKLRLIFLDVFFIVFASANLALAFEALTDVQGSCQSANINGKVNARYGNICGFQKALVTMLFVNLVSWLLTFAISCLRYVLH